MAISRGWKGIRVRGTPEFRRLVWKAATDRGLGVEGYRAGPGEKALRNEKQRERQEKQSGKQAGKQAGETTGDGKHSRPAPSPGFSSPEAKDSEPAERKEKPFSGEILNYGPAPYNHDPNNRPSFFVTIRAPDGTEATHWGLGLERAREEARANIGDHVKLTRHDRAITASKYATWSIQVYNPEILDGKEAEPQASSAESQVTDKPLVEGEKEPVSETQKPGEQGAQTSAPEKVETSELPNSRGNTPDRQEVQQHQQDPGTKIVEDFTEKRLKNWTPEEREAFQERFRELRSILSATEPDKGGAKTSDREHEHER